MTCSRTGLRCAAAALLFLVGWAASNRLVATSGIEDPQSIVVDEVVGQWLTLACGPLIIMKFLPHVDAKVTRTARNVMRVTCTTRKRQLAILTAADGGVWTTAPLRNGIQFALKLRS